MHFSDERSCMRTTASCIRMRTEVPLIIHPASFINMSYLHLLAKHGWAHTYTHTQITCLHTYQVTHTHAQFDCTNTPYRCIQTCNHTCTIYTHIHTTTLLCHTHPHRADLFAVIEMKKVVAVAAGEGAVYCVFFLGWVPQEGKNKLNAMFIPLAWIISFNCYVEE